MRTAPFRLSKKLTGSCQRGRSPSDFGSYRPALLGGRGVFGKAENISASSWQKRSPQASFFDKLRGRKTAVFQPLKSVLFLSVKRGESRRRYQPSLQPSSQPSSQPSLQLSLHPSCQPSPSEGTYAPFAGASGPAAEAADSWALFHSRC